MHSHHLAALAVLDASQAWIDQFNRQDGQACAAAYTADATMHAEPLARSSGRAEIEKFWCELIAQGARELRYHKLKLQVLSATEVDLSAEWTMNIGSGVITQERWQLGEDGVWRLAADQFALLVSNGQEG
ncbi:nuclear transport factor 2 family protein [Pseudomonas anguilliseptica]|uniref:SnoaL-like domain-containing protein n=1 Tax=Pseudomonas anguilliseptica TaxID=53406 RepID=A0A1H4TQN3_PSEAG|nr:nuclear transport factor 2 family protein [Pseudomonas anguilliseptica]SEC58391.1 SnoaL-like domain-containing protein [Pseudomonas anguilliseptica]